MSPDPVLRDLLAPALTRHAARPALVAGGRTWTYAELDRAARAVATELAARGVTAGSAVALILPNGAEYVVTDLAIALLGAAKVPLNLMLSVDEQAHILTDSGAEVVVVRHDRTAAVDLAAERGAAPQVIVVGGPNDGWSAALGRTPLAELPPVPPDARALVMYTGGTTGLPKGVLHRQRGLAMNLLSHLVEMELTAEDVLLLTSPLPHSAGFLLQTALAKGARVIVEEGFDVERVLDRIEQDGASYLFLVPTMIYRLLDAAVARPDVDTSALRTILYGAAPITPDRLEQGLALFGPVFVQLFAQSEAPNFLTRLRRDDHVAGGRLTSCGQSVLMAEVRVVREDGTACAAGEVGEVTARSPYTMEGYLGRPAETADALRDGWLHTGDLGYLTADGYLHLVDRKKDMIITGGLNVYSSEVEQALARLDGVKEVAVAGVPHPDWGEAVVAFVIPTDDGVTAASILAAARDELSSYKRPKDVVLVASLPTTAVGKVDKKALRAQVRNGEAS
ncbi:class I adenylate-forming enzyme family protein [Nocardioides nitrophenolicus]|uniref:class I adenylate-forming enzyme family protein n=1 Tax=Nocardioides nitrophenolicus TaxID=60489 RepID=UPI00195F1BA6|nr:AMP-binding protein [Nocardioides nitrophenolicus]MBM7518593.1 fatty-acyl-CoA synthase/long-chain acyl-CoA synthetase [Nocardioides nitrophenolicus]